MPPYTMAAREPVAYCGLNLVGLRRHGFSPEVIDQIHETYRLYYNAGMSREESFESIKHNFPNSKEVGYIIDFIKNSKRGVIK